MQLFIFLLFFIVLTNTFISYLHLIFLFHPYIALLYSILISHTLSHLTLPSPAVCCLSQQVTDDIRTDLAAATRLLQQCRGEAGGGDGGNRGELIKRMIPSGGDIFNNLAC